MGSGTAARILIADGHRVMRQTLSAAVEELPGWTVCGEATTAADLVTKAAGLAPDVIVMDVGLAGLDAITLVRKLRKANPSAAILVVAVYESRALSLQLQEAGANGYLLKPDVGHSLVQAIHALLGHGTFFRDRLQPEADRIPADHVGEDPHIALTARELEVLRLLAGGKSNKEVATSLNISVNTVETHRARVMNKLDLHSMNAVVRYALRKGLIDL